MPFIKRFIFEMSIVCSIFLVWGLLNSAIAQELVITRPATSLYQEPSLTGKPNDSVGIGSSVKLLEKSRNGKALKISSSTGKIGWIGTNYTKIIDPKSLHTILLEVARAYMLRPEEDSSPNLEVEKWIMSLKNDKNFSSLQIAELELYRLLCIQKIARTVQPDNTKLKTWTSTHKGYIYYSDYGNAGYFLDPQLLWKLESSLPANTPLKEQVAFEASNLEIGGECEGYWVCVLERAMNKAGNYLKKHPNGKNAAFFVNNLKEELGALPIDSIKEMDAADQKSTKKLASEWRAVLVKVPDSAAKKSLLAIFNKI
jgi:hypothetical protein